MGKRNDSIRTSALSRQNLLPFDGEAYYCQNFLSNEETRFFLHYFMQEIPWQQLPVKIFGKAVLQPRLTCSFADEGVDYAYSGLKLQNKMWSPTLLQLRGRAEQLAGQSFNTALLNQYRNGKDYMGWHRDNERSLGIDPVIVSLSFGAERIFQLRHYEGKGKPLSLLLESGSALLMKGKTQHCWEHRLPKAHGIQAPRVNITFRKVV